MFPFLSMTQADQPSVGARRRSFPRHLLHRITTLAISAVVVLVALIINLQRVNADQASRPNIVLLLADDLGYGELGCQGNPQIPTPHIDSIAAEGVRFTDGYVAASYCSASRAGLLSGRYPTRFGYEFNPIGHHNEDPEVGLPDGETTLAEHLRDAGYATGLIGKWHLGGHARYHPLRRGFDEFFGFLHEGHFFVPPPYDGVTTMLRRKSLPANAAGRWQRADGRLILSTHMGHNEPAYDANNPILRGGQPVVETEYLTDALTREAVDFVARNRDRPFFLYVAYNAVHSPLQAAEPYMQRFTHIGDVHRRIFAAMLANLDDGVGRVLESIQQHGLEEDTLVFFISDNGGPTRELTSSNLPLRGGKGDLYEGGIRVPFLLRWTGRLPAGAVYNEPVSALDVYATAASLAAAQIPNRRPIDGVDLLPYLTEEAAGSPHQQLFWRMGGRTALRAGDWKLVRNPMRGSSGEFELYNLADDISESHNLAESHPEQLARLTEAWQTLNGEMTAPAWRPQ